MSMQPIIEKALLTAIKPFCNDFGYSKRLYILRALRKDLNPEFAAVRTVNGCTPTITANPEIFLDEELVDYLQSKNRIVPLLNLYKKCITSFKLTKTMDLIPIEIVNLFNEIIVSSIIVDNDEYNVEHHENVISSILWYCTHIDCVNQRDVINLIDKLINYYSNSQRNIDVVIEIYDALSTITRYGGYVIHHTYDPNDGDDPRNQTNVSLHGYHLIHKYFNNDSNAHYLRHTKELSNYYKHLVKHYKGDNKLIIDELTALGSII